MTSKTAAHRYARALFDVALKEHLDLAAIEGELATFVDLFEQHPPLARVLLNPAVPAPRKRAAVAEITSTLHTTGVLTKLLAMLAERDRLIVLPDLLASYRDRLLEHLNVVQAEVTTAVPLSAERALQIEQRLAGMTGKTVRVSTRVDPSILGGVVTRIGSTVYDSSVAGQLERMKSRLMAGA